MKKNVLVGLLALGLLASCGGTEPAASSEAGKSSTPASSKSENKSSEAKSSSSKASTSKETPHSHAFANDGALVGEAQPIKCSCNMTGYDLTATGKTPTTGTFDGKLKGDLEWNVTGIAAGEYDVYMKAEYSTGNGSATFTSGEGLVEGYASRYLFQVDAGNLVAIETAESYEGLGFPLTGTGAEWSNAALCKVTVAAGAAKFAIRYHAEGYSCYVAGIRLVKRAA